MIARFYQSDRWSYTGGEVSAQVTEYADGRGFLRIEAISSSGAFKYFSEPHGVLIVTDAGGQVIAEAVVSGLAMRMSLNGVYQKRDSRTAQIKAGEFSSVAYAFFASKYCGWRQTFDRTVGENNGCYQSDLRKEYKAFVADLPKALAGIAIRAGENFPVLGWQGVRLR